MKWPITCEIQILNLISSVEMGFVPLVSFASQRAPGTRVVNAIKLLFICSKLKKICLTKSPNYVHILTNYFILSRIISQFTHSAKLIPTVMTETLIALPSGISTKIYMHSITSILVLHVYK